MTEDSQVVKTIRALVGNQGAEIAKEIEKDPQAFLNTPHLPEDAGEYAEGLTKILNRIPEGWGRWISCGPGWYPLLIETDEKLAAIDPDYILAQAKEKLGCYDEETDVLTGEGWKHFRDVSMDDTFATLDSNGNLTYQSPSDIIAYPYQGKMYRLEARGVDLLVTPNHRLYVSKPSYYNGKIRGSVVRRDYEPEIVGIEEIWGKRKCFHKGAVWIGKDSSDFTLPAEDQKRLWDRGYGFRMYHWDSRTFPMDVWIKFLGWYISEGSVSRSGRDVAISLNNTDGGTVLQIVESLLGTLGIKFHRSQPERSAINLRIYDVQIGRWLEANCGRGAHNKHVPQFIGDLSPRQIEVFLDNLYMGDGHQSPTARILTTVSPHLANQVQELLLKAGFTSRRYALRPARDHIFKDGSEKIIHGNYDAYEINWLKSSNIFHTSPTTIEKWDEYDGMVYCATVPNGLLHIRRNGKPVWCGNSLRYYFEWSNAYTGDGKEGREIVSEAEMRSGTICEDCGEPGVLREGGWLTTLCDEHSKGRSPHEGLH